MPDAGILCGDMLLIQQKPVSAIHPGNLVLVEELHCRFTDIFCDIRPVHLWESHIFSHHHRTLKTGISKEVENHKHEKEFCCVIRKNQGKKNGARGETRTPMGRPTSTSS